MAPLAAGILGSAPEALLPGVTLMTVLFILVLFIMLLALCSSCKRNSFDLEDSKPENNPSSLLHVMKLDKTKEGRDNPSHSWVTMDEIDAFPAPENSIVQMNTNSAHEPYQPWRNHTGILRPQGETHAGIQELSNPNTPRESSGPFIGNLRVQRIPIDPVASIQQVPASVVSPLRDMDSMQESGLSLMALGHSVASADKFQLSQGSDSLQNPTASLQHSQSENIYEVATGDRGPISMILPYAHMTQEDFVNPAYHTAEELMQLQSDVTPPSHVSDSQNGNAVPPTLQEEEGHESSAKRLNDVYAKVSKKSRNQELPPPPSVPPPVNEDHGEEWEEIPIPPLPQQYISHNDCTTAV
ncbi:uncharacterized protein LOC108924043 [Scleropages formosus]|uniref:uncharacterized protein LOC108924043 n=1 Tax=Scleropages formosus TaxID=113540 RepID=UPI0010FA9EEA|nr:uncharacterized protein LOC108924043 [Scleropages formosus]XP_018590667.2 uncharacterized protein LOC108924043 [Scleropages formosus]XP_018590668.2 uncharacterized protein LOC108924043 [Scleropages formosus]XP_018590669.2 uncharacterized protein LOC108924043 [Scleropages formosus]XP_018590670.2 uncharacterized protein LOC108924043 [Scleropages formosus]XP_018590671.2 uncharacterized protein LOC108924043 [Scleropages formosus]XP_029111683.1 uncharacterized protein LOC108924043 [Scleropages 